MTEKKVFSKDGLWQLTSPLTNGTIRDQEFHIKWEYKRRCNYDYKPFNLL